MPGWMGRRRSGWDSCSRGRRGFHTPIYRGDGLHCLLLLHDCIHAGCYRRVSWSCPNVLLAPDGGAAMA